MIFQAIDILKQELNLNLTSPLIKSDYGNISEILNDPNNNGSDADIIISLINIEENRISRDPHNYVRKLDGSIVLKNPAIHLYLTLLFTSIKREGYGIAIKNLQAVIGYFQKKFVYDHANTPGLDAGIERLILDMVSLNLQQLHEIWTVLGGRYFPSVVYRMRMVTIDNIDDGKPGPLITQIETDYYSI